MLDFVQFIVSLAPGTLLVLPKNYVRSKDHIVMWYPYNIWGRFPVCKNTPESWMIPPYNVNLLPVYAPTSVCRSMHVKVETARASMAVKPQKPSGLWMPVNGFSFLHFVHWFHCQLCCHRHNSRLKTAQADIWRSPHNEPGNNEFLFAHHSTTMPYV